MLVRKTCFIEICFEFINEDFFEQIFELTVVGLQDGVLGAHVHGVITRQAITKRRASKVADAVVEVVHTHRDAAVFAKLCDFELHWLTAVFWRVGHCDRASAWNFEVCCLVLVAMRVTTNNNWLCPARYQARDV